MNVAASGIRGAALDGYLPPGVKTAISDGRFNATILASRLHGVRSAYLDVMKLDWRDGDSTPFASFDLARLAASNLDWYGDSVSIEELSVSNLQSNLTIDANGNQHLLGLVLSNVPPATQPTTNPAEASGGALPSAADVSKPLPTMVLGKLDLNVARFTVRDERRAGSAPMEIVDLEVKNTAPITLGGRNPESQPVAHLEITGTIDPVVKQFKLTLDAAPLAPSRWRRSR